MTSYSTTYKTVDLVYCGVPLKVIGVEFFPAVGATDIDPPEPPFCAWERVEIGGVDVTDLFQGDMYHELDNELTSQLEGETA